MPRIELTSGKSGAGEAGDVLDVSEMRAERWCGKGWAKSLDVGPAPKAASPAKPKTNPRKEK